MAEVADIFCVDIPVEVAAAANRVVGMGSRYDCDRIEYFVVCLIEECC